MCASGFYIMESAPMGALHYSGAMKPLRAQQAAPLRTDSLLPINFTQTFY